MDLGMLVVVVFLGAVIIGVVLWGTASHTHSSQAQKKIERLADHKTRAKRYQDFIQNLHPAYLQPNLRLLLLMEQEKLYLHMQADMPQNTEVATLLDENRVCQKQLRAGQYRNNAERAKVPQAAVQVQAKLKALGDFLEQLHERRELGADAFKQYYQSLHWGFMQAEVDTEMAVGMHAMEQNNLYAANHHFNRALSTLQPNNINGHFQDQIDEIRALIAQLHHTGDSQMGSDVGQSMHNSAEKKWDSYLNDKTISSLKKTKDGAS